MVLDRFLKRLKIASIFISAGFAAISGLLSYKILDMLILQEQYIEIIASCVFMSGIWFGSFFVITQVQSELRKQEKEEEEGSLIRRGVTIKKMEHYIKVKFLTDLDRGAIFLEHSGDASKLVPEGEYMLIIKKEEG